MLYVLFCLIVFFFSSRRRHTRCALVTGVQTCALPIFGLASHPGGRKWRARYEAEREAHAAYREQTEARIDALQRENAALGHDRVAVPADPRPIDAPARGQIGRAHV